MNGGYCDGSGLCMKKMVGGVKGIDWIPISTPPEWDEQGEDWRTSKNVLFINKDGAYVGYYDEYDNASSYQGWYSVVINQDNIRIYDVTHYAYINLPEES